LSRDQFRLYYGERANLLHCLKAEEKHPSLTPDEGSFGSSSVNILGMNPRLPTEGSHSSDRVRHHLKDSMSFRKVDEHIISRMDRTHMSRDSQK
jgi:hypothetical protein